MSIVLLNIEYFNDPNTGKPLSGGSVYIGIPDLDPFIEANRISVTIQQEDGSDVVIAPSAQPITLNPAGRFQYLGSPVQVLTTQNYSIRVDNTLGVQKYYNPDAKVFITQSLVSSDVFLQTAIVSTMVAGTVYNIGEYIKTSGFIFKGDKGVNTYEVVASGTGIADGGQYIDLPNTTPPLQAKGLFPNGVNLRQWGMIGDGIVDDMQQFINACLYMKNTGGELGCVPGNYLLNTDTGSAEIEGFVLKGSGVYSPIAPTDYGCAFSITGTTNNPFKIGRGGQIRGVSFYYPNQVLTNPPTVYPLTILFDYTLSPDLSGNVQGVVIEDCTAFNPYDFIDLGPSGPGSSQGNTRIRNNRFYSLNKGIIVRDTLTNIFVTDNSWSPEFWTDSIGQPVRDYVALSGVAVDYINGDNLWFTNNTVFGYGVGLDYSNEPGAGSAIFQQIADNIFDGTRIGIQVRGESATQGIIISGNQFLAKNFGDANDFTCRAIYINNPSQLIKMSINSNYFGPTSGHHIQITDVTGLVNGNIILDGNQYEFAGNNDATSTEYYSLIINAANMDISITDSFFRHTNRVNNVGVKSFNARSLTINDNKFDSAFRVAIIDACDYLQFNNNWSRNTQDATDSYSIGVIANDAVIENNQFDKQINVIGFTDLDATPSIVKGSDFSAAYTAPTTITTLTGGRTYKVVRIRFDTADHTIDFSSSNMRGNSGVDWTPTVGSHMTCWYDGSAWFCTVANA